MGGRKPMKKLTLIILTFTMILSLCACGSEGKSTSQQTTEETETTRPSTEAPTEKAATTEATAATEAEQPLWDTTYYVDDFNQPTNDKLIYNSTYFIGKFSNSATTNSSLYVQMVVDKSDVTFFLIEYGSHQVKNSSSTYDDTYNITMRTADGLDHSLTGYIPCGGDRLVIDEAYVSEVINAINNQDEDTITYFFVQSTQHSTTQYLFGILSGNFAEQYKLLK